MIELKIVKRTDERYVQIRDRHYIPNRGCHGQQLHYLVYDDGDLAGIISGASAVYGCAPRDTFFALSKERKIKQAQLNQIINNVVFRLEKTRPNLASMVLARWRRQISEDWKYLYQVDVVGFETFVIEERREGMSDRLGTLYLADNWTAVGMTKGNTKAHETTSGSGGMNAKHTRRETVPKIILCKRNKNVKFIDTYTSSWKDKDKSKELAQRRRHLFAGSHNRELF